MQSISFRPKPLQLPLAIKKPRPETPLLKSHTSMLQKLLLGGSGVAGVQTGILGLSTPGASTEDNNDIEASIYTLPVNAHIVDITHYTRALAAGMRDCLAIYSSDGATKYFGDNTGVVIANDGSDHLVTKAVGIDLTAGDYMLCSQPSNPPAQLRDYYNGGGNGGYDSNALPWPATLSLTANDHDLTLYCNYTY